MNIYVFDLDNTIVMTDELNNKAYNYALASFNLSPLNIKERITREIIRKQFPSLNNYFLTQIIKLKQKYFINNLKYTSLNKDIYLLIKKIGKTACILWTKAEVFRTIPLLVYHNLIDSFAFILISKKKYILNDIQIICQRMNCQKENLFFWDDDYNNIIELQACGIQHICYVA